MTVQTNAKDLTAIVRRRLEQWLPTSPQGRRKVLAIMRILNNEAQLSYGKSGLKRRTGLLVNSLRSELKSIPEGVLVFISANPIYSRIHEFGGVIRPKRSNLLRFQVGGRWVSARSVTIPARPYLRPTLIRSRDKIMKTLAKGN
jgi:phage gpG-like protein